MAETKALISFAVTLFSQIVGFLMRRFITDYLKSASRREVNCEHVIGLIMLMNRFDDNLNGLEVEFLGLWSKLNLDEPILEKYLSIMGKQIDFEVYTTAGIHKHQVENEGYGLITSDEGHRDILSCATVLWNH